MDYMSLHPRTSWERGNRSRTWWRILFWGLLDRVQTNTFIIFRKRWQPARCEHSLFHKNLTTQLFNIARARKEHDEIRKACAMRDTVEFSVLHPPHKMPSFHEEMVDLVSSNADDSDGPPVFRHKRGKLTKQLACYNCRRLGRGAIGSKRKGREDSFRKLYAKTFYGCKSCNVPLCNKHNCWSEYHNSNYVGQTDLDAKTVWL